MNECKEHLKASEPQFNLGNEKPAVDDMVPM